MLVTTRKRAPPPPKLLHIVRLPLKFNQSVIGVSTKSIHEWILLKSDDLMRIYAKNDEKWCFLHVLGEKKRVEKDPKNRRPE